MCDRAGYRSTNVKADAVSSARYDIFIIGNVPDKVPVDANGRRFDPVRRNRAIIRNVTDHVANRDTGRGIAAHNNTGSSGVIDRSVECSGADHANAGIFHGRAYESTVVWWPQVP